MTSERAKARCTAKAKSTGSRCRRNVVEGERLCRTHRRARRRASDGTVGTVTRAGATKTRGKPAVGWEESILTALRQWPIITVAARNAKVSRSTLYRHMEESPEFREAVEEATADGLDRVEFTHMQLAVNGWDEPVFGRVGKDEDGEIGTIHKHDLRAMQFILARRHLDYRRADQERLDEQRAIDQWEGWNRDLIRYATAQIGSAERGSA